MSDYFKPDFGEVADSPFARNEDGVLVRKSFWLDMSDKSVVQAMTVGIGANLSNDNKRAHLNDIGRPHLIEDICIQEVLPPTT